MPINHRRHLLRAADKSASSLFRFVITDHTYLGPHLRHISSLPLRDQAKFTLEMILISIFTAILQAIWIFLLFAFVIPFLLTGSFF